VLVAPLARRGVEEESVRQLRREPDDEDLDEEDAGDPPHEPADEEREPAQELDRQRGPRQRARRREPPRRELRRQPRGARPHEEPRQPVDQEDRPERDAQERDPPPRVHDTPSGPPARLGSLDRVIALSRHCPYVRPRPRPHRPSGTALAAPAPDRTPARPCPLPRGPADARPPRDSA